MASVSRTVLHNTFLTLPPSASDFDFMEDLPLPPEMVDWDSYNISDCSESPRINGVRPERSHPSVRFTLSDAELLGFPVSFSPVIPESESQEEFGKGTGGIFCRLEDEEPTEDKTEESVPEAAGPSASTRESSHPSTPSAGSSPSSSFNEGDDDTPDSSMDAICTPPYETVFIPKGTCILDNDLPSSHNLPSVLLPSSHLPSPDHQCFSSPPSGNDDLPCYTPAMTFVISNNIVEPHVETTSDDTLAEPSVAKPLQECVADDHVTNSCESPRPDQDAFPLSPTSHALDAPHKRPRTQSASPPPSSMEKRPRHVSLPPAPHLAPPLNGFSRLTPEPSPVLPIQTLASTQQATLQSVARPDGGVWQTISNTFMNCLPKASSSDLPPPSPELHATPVDYADDDQLATPKPIVNMCVAEPHTPPSPPPSPGVESEADGPGRCLSALSDHDCEDVSRDVSPNVFTAIDGCEGLSVVQTMTPSPTPGLMPPTLTNERSVPSSVDGFPFHTQMDLPTPTSLTKVNALELSIASSLLTSVRSSSEPPGSTHVTGELSSQKPVLSAFESARMPRASSAQPRVPRKLFVSSLSLTLPHAALPPPLRPPTTPLEDFTPPPMSDLRTVIRSPDPTATSASPPADMSLPIKTVEEHASASPHESAPPSVSAPARLKGGAGYNKKAELRDLQLTAESLLKGSWHEGRRSGTRSSMATSSSPAVETATTVRALDADTANLGENAKKSPSAPPSQSPTRSRLPTPVQPDSVPHLTRSVMAAVAASATSPQSGTKEEPLDPSFSFSSSRIPRKKAKNEVAESVVHAVRQAKKRGSYSTPPKFMKGSVSRRAPSSILSQVANIREESPDPLALGPTSSERGLESPPRKRARPLYKKPKRPDRSYCDEENEIIDSYFPLEDSEGHPTKDAATKCSNALVKAGYQRRSEGALQWRVRTIVWPEKRNAE